MLEVITNYIPLETIEGFYTQFVAFTKANPVVGGVMSLWVLGVVTFITKFIPGHLKSFFHKQFTVTLVIHNKDEIFFHLSEWYEKEGMGKKARTLQVDNKNWGTGETRITAGYGNHYFWRGVRPFKMYRVEKDSQSLGSQIKESIHITTIGRSQKSIRKLVKSCIPDAKENNITKVYRWSDDWEWSHNQPNRTLDSVVLPQSTKKKLIDSIKQFEDDREFYEKNGIPYHLGICLFGVPGTGKTSVIKALCDYLGRNLYIVNLNRMNDATLENALSKAGKKALVLMEDVDTEAATSARKNVVDSVNELKSNNEITKSRSLNDMMDPMSEAAASFGFSLTLSGILNAIDGVTSSNGRVLVMTTNDPDKLDPALKRRGRIDVMLEIGVLTDETFREMFSRLYEGYTAPEDAVFRKNVTPAELQGLILEHRQNPEYVLSQMVVKECSYYKEMEL